MIIFGTDFDSNNVFHLNMCFDVILAIIRIKEVDEYLPHYKTWFYGKSRPVSLCANLSQNQLQGLQWSVMCTDFEIVYPVCI